MIHLSYFKEYTLGNTLIVLKHHLNVMDLVFY